MPEIIIGLIDLSSVHSERRSKGGVFCKLRETRGDPWGFGSTDQAIEKGDPSDLIFPKWEYDQEALAFYAYARVSSPMPLLAYLAYYQVLEYYFPKYGEQDARFRLLNVLREPTFDPENHRHLSRALDAVRASTLTANERAQLKTALKECVVPDDLKAFIEADTSLKDAIRSKLNEFQVHVNNPKLDLIQALGDRIYDIRCRIVHSKQDDGSFALPILPFSVEATMLAQELRLMRYLAYRVLVANGKQFP